MRKTRLCRIRIQFCLAPNPMLLATAAHCLPQIWSGIEPLGPQQQSSYKLLNSTPGAPLKDPQVPRMDQKQYRAASWRGVQKGIPDASIMTCVCLCVCIGVCVGTDDQRQMMITEKRTSAPRHAFRAKWIKNFKNDWSEGVCQLCGIGGLASELQVGFYT